MQTVLVETSGKCVHNNGSLAVAVSRGGSKRQTLAHAQQYKAHTPQKALALMEADPDVPFEDIPSERQLEEARRERAVGPRVYLTPTMGLLSDFVNNPPVGVHIFTEGTLGLLTCCC